MQDQRQQPSRGEAPALVFSLLFPVAAAYLYFVVAGNSPWLASIYSASKAVQFAFPLVWLAWAEGWHALRLPLAALSGLSRDQLDLPSRPRAAILPGIASGILMAGGLVGVYVVVLRGGELMAAMAPRIAARVDTIGVGTPVRYLLLALFLSIIHSFLEEYYWRSFVFARLNRRLGMPAAIVVSCLGFAAHHVIVLDSFLRIAITTSPPNRNPAMARSAAVALPRASGLTRVFSPAQPSMSIAMAQPTW